MAKLDPCKFAKLDTACKPLCDPFELDGSELCVFDTWAEEKMEAHGTPVKYYHQDIEGSERDPLYDEPVDREFRGPFLLKGFVEYPPGVPEMTENGMRVTWTGIVYFARATLEAKGLPTPLEGDILQFWDEVLFFREHGVNGEDVPGAGYYFDVVNVDDDGHIFDSAAFTHLKMEIRRRTEFTPERRLAG